MALIEAARRQRRQVCSSLKHGRIYMATLVNSSLSQSEKEARQASWRPLGRNTLEPKLRVDGGGRSYSRTVDPFNDYAVSTGTVAAFYCKYCGADGTMIAADGLKSLWRDVGLVGSRDKRALAILWRFKAERTDVISRKTFMDGCLDLNTDSVDRLRREMPNLLYDARRNFKDFYYFVFRVTAATSDDKGSTDKPCISRAGAVALWRETLPLCSGDALKFEDSWYSFLQAREIKKIDERCWKAFLRFSQAVEKDMSNFAAVASDWWPSVLSDYATHQSANQSS